MINALSKGKEQDSIKLRMKGNGKTYGIRESFPEKCQDLKDETGQSRGTWQPRWQSLATCGY